MNVPEKDLQLLRRIFDYCRKIEKTVDRFGNDFDLFVEDSDFVDSVSMNLLQIGELAGKISSGFAQSTNGSINWRAIKNMRNMFAHDYGSMDIEKIWETAIYDVPSLKQYCDGVISETDNEYSADGSAADN